MFPVVFRRPKFVCNPGRLPPVEVALLLVESGSQESTDPRTDSKGPEPTVPWMFVDAFFLVVFLSCFKKRECFIWVKLQPLKLGKWLVYNPRNLLTCAAELT